MTWQASLARRLARLLARRRIASATDPGLARARFERSARRLFRMPPLTLRLEGAVGGVPGLWVQNHRRAEGVILFLYGGGYIVGSPATHAALAAALALRTGLPAFLPAYRHAPEHPFPAAFEDALAAFEGLLARGYAPHEILLAGESAGGGLALALLSRLCHEGRRPAGLVAFSPWTDLTLSGASLVTNAQRELILPAHRLTELRAMILGGARPADADDPRLSPLHASFPAPPPVQLHAASTEILRDDALRMRSRLPDAEIVVADDLPHGWTLLQGLVPEADATLDNAARFIRACMPQGSAES